MWNHNKLYFTKWRYIIYTLLYQDTLDINLNYETGVLFSFISLDKHVICLKYFALITSVVKSQILTPKLAFFLQIIELYLLLIWYTGLIRLITWASFHNVLVIWSHKLYYLGYNHKLSNLFCNVYVSYPYLSLITLELKYLIDPWTELWDPCVNSRLILFCTPDSPANDAREHKSSIFLLHDHWSATVTL